MVVWENLFFPRQFFCIIGNFLSIILFKKSHSLGRRLILSIGIFFFNSPFLWANSSQLCSVRHLYLTWQDDPSTTITVNIHGLKTANELYVFYDTEPRLSKIQTYRYKQKGAGIKTLNLPDGRQLYHIELTGLKPGETYYFTIGDALHPLIHEQKFKTIPLEYETLTFIEGGDWENTPNAELLANKAGEYNPAAVFLGGDYPSGVHGKEDYKKWDRWLDTFRKGLITKDGYLVPMVLAIGNHEVIGGFGQTKEHAPFFFHYFPQEKNKKSYFSLAFGTLFKLFVLDSGHTASHSGEQLTWLKNEMENSSDYPIKMAVYHVPIYPSVRFAEKSAIYFSVYGLVEFYDNVHKAEKLFSYESKQGRKHWLPVFDQYQLTAAFEHHDQTLKRTKLLKNGKENSKGTLYLGDGGWGPRVQYPPIQAYFHQYFAKVEGKTHFFWLVKVSKNSICYEAISPSGKVVDQFIQNL